MANDLFNGYLSYAEEKATEFANLMNLDVEDIKQDARMTLFEMSEKYDGDYHYFGKYLETALKWTFKRVLPTYSVIRYPDYIAPHIHYISKSFDEDKTFEENVKVVTMILEIDEVTAREEVQYFINIRNANNHNSLNEDAFANICLEIAKEKAFADYFEKEKILNLIRVIREYCNEREADIIVRKLGLLGRSEPLNSMVDRYNVCKQRIGQIYDAGMLKLSTPKAKRDILIALEIGC